MRKLLWFLLFVPLLAFGQGGTYSSDILPASTGLNLGNPNQQWNLFSQDIGVYRNFRLNNGSGIKNFNILPNFGTSLVTCTQQDGTRCYFDSGSATTNGLKDCGVWSPQLAYTLQCVVQYQGSSWVANTPSTGIAPGTDNNVNWRLFAAAGIAGVDGTNGSNGAPGTPGYSPNQLLSGGGVVWISDYNYTVSAASYLIQNQAYSSPQTNISLTTSDPTDPRCDLVYVTNLGTVGVATGVAASQPACPVLDPSTLLSITALRVDANTTQPATVFNTDIYHEGTEWTMSKAGSTINLLSTNNPHTGTIDIEGTNTVTNNSFTATIPSGSVDLATQNTFVFYIRLKAVMPTTRNFIIQWFSGSTAKGAAVTLACGNFGLNCNNTASYQQIVIPTTVFGINGTALTAVRFLVSGTNTGTFGWYVDDIILQSGIPPSQGSNAMIWRDPWNILRAYGVNDTVSYQNNIYIAMSPNVGQTPSQTSTIWHPGTNAGPPFVSNSTNPASTGILRMANLDKACWRNAGNSADLCFWLDGSDVWNLDGNASGTELTFLEEASAASTAPAALYATVFVDSTSHLPCTKINGGTVTCPGTGGGSITGSGTTGSLTKFTGSTAIGNADLTGDVTTSGTVATTIASKYKIGTCEVVVGDPGAASPVLVNDNDTPSVCKNSFGSDYIITTVTCYADAGSPTVTPILHGGSGTSILSGALTCGTAALAAGTLNGTPTVHTTSGTGATCSSTPCTLDMNITTAGGTAKYIVVDITYTY